MALMACVAAACMQPSPATPGMGAEAMPTSICAAFVAQYEQQVGGQPAAAHTFYAAADGTVQQTREDTDDIVTAWRQGAANTADLLEGLAALLPSLPAPTPPASPDQWDNTVLELPEYTPPMLFVELTGCPSALGQWEGDATALPVALAELLEQAGKLAGSLPQSSMPPGQRFIRAQELGAEQVELLRRAGLIVEITGRQLAGCPWLERALSAPRRLFAVPAEADLYGDIALTFTHQKSAHVALGERVYQIRHLVARQQISWEEDDDDN